MWFTREDLRVVVTADLRLYNNKYVSKVSVILLNVLMILTLKPQI